MINPNISKRIIAQVNEDITLDNQYRESNATYRGHSMKVMLRDKALIEAGNRRLYLKFSIVSDSFYLSDRA